MSEPNKTKEENPARPKDALSDAATADAAAAQLQAEMDAAAEADAARHMAAEDDDREEGVYSDEEAALIIAQAEVADLKDKLLRAVAETENIRRRSQREQEDARKFAVSDFARDLLAVADNLRRAIEAVAPEVRQNHAEVATLLEGVELTERELQGAFERHGIETVDPVGEKLDPNLHQAVMQLDDPSVEPGTVVQVMQIGYTLNGRLLRPAMVGVAKK